MKVVIDKILLYFLLATLGVLCDFSDKFIVIMLLAIIVSCLNYARSDRKWTMVIGIIYLILCYFEPLCSIFIPLLFYDFIYYECPFICFISIWGFYQFFISYSRVYSVFLLGMVLISILLPRRTKDLLKLEKEFKRLRDDSMERTLLLQAQYKAVLESQEYQIHYATLQERNRIAREIHDNVGHMLSRSILQVGALLAINNENEIQPYLADLKDTLSEAMNSIRSSVHNLHDESIDLKSTIERLIESMKQYDVEFSYSMHQEVNSGVKYCFITTVKEALSNVVKHSNATKIIIFMVETDSHYQLNIKDNGTKERKADILCSPGMGLENMRVRAESLGGSCSVHRKDGFQIYMSIPKNKEP